MQGVPSQRSVSLSRLTTCHFTESGPARPHGSVNICEVKKDWAGDEPARSMRRRDLVSRKGSALVSSVLAGDPGLVGPSNSV